MSDLLTIENLHASIEGAPILHGLSLTMAAGAVHAIMGPNGSGKTTLAGILAGKEDYEITDGTIRFNGENLLEMEVEERSHAGLFLAFQYPTALPGVSGTIFMREAANAHQRAKGEEEYDPLQFTKRLRAKAKEMGIKDEMLKRAVNDGFSGGEKKRYEMLQMAMLEPRLAVLDETDSGLDIDALKSVAETVNNLRDGVRSFLIITHYQRLLDHIVPDHIHIMAEGRILRSGGKEVAAELEASGYAGLLAANGAGG